MNCCRLTMNVHKTKRMNVNILSLHSLTHPAPIPIAIPIPISNFNFKVFTSIRYSMFNIRARKRRKMAENFNWVDTLITVHINQFVTTHLFQMCELHLFQRVALYVLRSSDERTHSFDRFVFHTFFLAFNFGFFFSRSVVLFTSTFELNVVSSAHHFLLGFFCVRNWQYVSIWVNAIRTYERTNERTNVVNAFDWHSIDIGRRSWLYTLRFKYDGWWKKKKRWK